MLPKTSSVLSFVPIALTASQVGTWESNVSADVTVADPTAAALFGVDPIEASHGLPLNCYTKNIHPHDRAVFTNKLGSIRDRGGLFVIEYRTCPSPTDVRWVLARGRYERDPRTSEVVGRGIVIDITESKLDGQVEDRAFFAEQPATRPSLEHVAEVVLDVRSEIDELGEREDSPMRRAIDALLWIIGRALAQRGPTARAKKSPLN